jgi:formylglycine-generating enzyme required for sulfatase activity
MRHLVSIALAIVLVLTGCAPDTNDGGITDGTQAFRDCDACPLMVTIPAGRFEMGTAVEDRLTDPRTGKPATSDGPQHEVRFAEPFALGKYEVTVDEFAAFVADTGHVTTDRCMDFSKKDSFSFNEDLDWSDVGFAQAGTQPVVCVSFFDARAYADWLTAQTGKNYRLPSEAEWEYAARAGATGPYHWGDDRRLTCDYANVRSQGAWAISKRQAEADRTEGFPCDDGVQQSSAVGRFKPNSFGLHDVQGNAWEWVADCNHKNYEGAPSDGSVWLDEGRCQFGVIRGGSYLNLVERSTTTVRAGRPQTGGATNMGFRIARGDAGAISGTGEADAKAAVAALIDTGDLSHGAQLFDENCAACHVERNAYTGIYGTDQRAVEAAIRGGGNNTMSMPAFGETLTGTEIAELASYVRRLNHWD